MSRRPVAGGGLVLIRVAAQRSGLHPQTIRVYEAEGLIKPTRSEGGTRLYSEKDIDRLKRIATMTQELGLNLAGVVALLNMEARVTRAERELEAQRRLQARREAVMMSEIRRLQGMIVNIIGELPPGEASD